MSEPALSAFEDANVSRITDQLWIGGDLDLHDSSLRGRQLRELVDAGLTHVCDARIEWSDEDYVGGEASSVGYHWNGIDDQGQTVPPEWFEDHVAWALAALEDDDAVVLAHCHMGVNRGPSLGFAILLGLGWDPVDAIATIRDARSIAAVYYAEDALVWHHQRLGSDPEALAQDQERLRAWREENPLDVEHVTAEVEARERRAAD